MDKAPDFGSGDCRFESCHGRSLFSSNGHFIFWIWSLWLESICFTTPIPNMHTIAVMWLMCLFLKAIDNPISMIKDDVPLHRRPMQCKLKQTFACLLSNIYRNRWNLSFHPEGNNFHSIAIFATFFTSAKILIKLHKVKVWIYLNWAE